MVAEKRNVSYAVTLNWIRCRISFALKRRRCTIVRPSVRTSKCVQYFSTSYKAVLRALQLSGSREHKSDYVAYEYTYQDHDYTREHAGHVWGERERVVPVEQITD